MRPSESNLASTLPLIELAFRRMEKGSSLLRPDSTTYMVDIFVTRIEKFSIGRSPEGLPCIDMELEGLTRSQFYDSLVNPEKEIPIDLKDLERILKAFEKKNCIESSELAWIHCMTLILRSPITFKATYLKDTRKELIDEATVIGEEAWVTVRAWRGEGLNSGVLIRILRGLDLRVPLSVGIVELIRMGARIEYL